jgi:HEAT repeat protein
MNLFMKKLFKPLLVGAVVLALALPALARAPKSEDELMTDLGSPKPNVVISAMQDIEKNYPTSVPAQTKVKTLLTDARDPVKRKAARVLGAINADVSDADLKSIATLLTGDKGDKEDGLKALRGLKAQSTIPQITPLLQDSDLNVKRDAIRTLAVLGDKSLVPTIQPLLAFPDLAVQKDAADAIEILKAK